MISRLNPAGRQTKKIFVQTSQLVKKAGLSKATKDKIEEECEAVGDKTKNILTKTSSAIQNAGPIQQLLVGSFSGWCTGFLTTRVGKTAALSVGGSILLVSAASQTGYISINWNKINSKANRFTENVSDTVDKGVKSPQVTSLSQYARTNVYLAAGFIGGFLLGICC